MDRNSKRLVSADVELSVVLPLHPRARPALVDLGFEQRLTAMSQLRVVDPLGYLDFLKLMSETRIGLTDSRGDDVRGRQSQDRQLHRYLARTLAVAEGLSGYGEALRLLPDTLDPVERLRHLPILERRHIQANPDGFRDPKHPAIEIHTSGSAGIPLTYHLAHRARLRRLSQYVRFFNLHGWRPWHRSLSLKVLPDSSQRVGHRWLDRTVLARRRTVSVLDPLEAFRAFRQVDPQILHGFPSILEELAAECHERGWKPSGLLRIFTSSESLEPETKAQLESAFGAPVIDHYGAAEGFIGWQCEERAGFHVNARSVWLEILNDDDEPVAPGEVGRVIITTLDNPAMPLLRYAIGDQAVLGRAGECPCGRGGPFIREIRGRRVDVFHLPGGSTSAWGLVARMREIESLMRFQLIQTGRNSIEVRYQSKSPSSPVDQGLIIQLVQSVLGEEVEALARETTHFERLPSGKFAPALRQWSEPSSNA